MQDCNIVYLTGKRLVCLMVSDSSHGYQWCWITVFYYWGRVTKNILHSRIAYRRKILTRCYQSDQQWRRGLRLKSTPMANSAKGKNIHTESFHTILHILLCVKYNTASVPFIEIHTDIITFCNYIHNNKTVNQNNNCRNSFYKYIFDNHIVHQRNYKLTWYALRTKKMTFNHDTRFKSVHENWFGWNINLYSDTIRIIGRYACDGGLSSFENKIINLNIVIVF